MMSRFRQRVVAGLAILGLCLLAAPAAAQNGTLSGTITDSATSLPITNAQVYLYTSAGTYSGFFATPNGSGVYSISASAGSYFAVSFNSIGYIDEVYNNITCIPCPFPTITSGTPISVTTGQTTSGVDFALAPGGRISGMVTNGATGAPVPTVGVYIRTSAGAIAGGALSDASGNYISQTGLPAGSYYVITLNRSGLFDELYNDVPCDLSCLVGGFASAGGTLVTVTAPNTTSNVNFALSPGGRITGRITSASTGAPIPLAQVLFYDSAGYDVTQTIADANGFYASNRGLPAGSYYARTFNTAGYAEELYNNVPCSACSMTGSGGTLIPVTVPNATSNIDFALEMGGRISGRVTNAATGAGVAGMFVDVYRSNGSGAILTTTAYTDTNGSYVMPGGLTSGSYFVRTRNTIGFVDELYNDIPCLACDPTVGPPVAVVAGQITSNIDFALNLGGRISGTVTGAGGSPLANLPVRVYTANGQLLGSVNSDSLGRYVTSGLPPGSYFVRTANNSGLLDKLFNDRPCAPCDSTTGTAVVVSGSAETPGIDFSLTGGGRIAGTVTASTGEALAGVTVSVYSPAGLLVTSATTNGSGQYSTPSVIPGGSYYVRTANSTFYINQVYRARDCLNCNASTGAPVGVVAGQTTSGIDFALARGGRVTGVVTTVAGAPIAGVTVRIFTTAGEVSSGISDAQGSYFTTTGLPTGTYYARTSDAVGYVDQIYKDVVCAICSPAVGTPVAVTAGQDAGSVNFSLGVGASLSGAVVESGPSQAIAGALVSVYGASGALVTTAVSDAAGLYATPTILAAGKYFLIATSSLGFVSTAYDNLLCEACSPIAGTPLVVSAGEQRANVNFSLGRGGAVTGVVTEAGTGLPLRDIKVLIYNQNNNFVASAQTDVTGRFTSGFRLPSGTYFARTTNSQGFIDELYNDTPCLVCAENGGTAIVVTSGQATANVDFQLTKGGRLKGVVTESGTNLPIANVTIDVFNASNRRMTQATTDSAGQYQTTGLPAGTYYARTTNSQGFVDKVFDNTVCLVCDPTRGSAIVVGGAAVPGVSFSLSLGARIAGTITSTATSAAIGNVRVAIYNLSGALVGESFSNAAGQYITTGLTPGNYLLRTFNRLGYVDEAFDNQQCGRCVMTAVGTARAATTATIVTGTNFALDPGGWVSGWVIDALTRAPLAGVTVSFFQNGVFVARSAPSDTSGYYGISLPVGAYSAQADLVQGYVVQVLPGLRAAAIGNVSVEIGLETPGVEFPLDKCQPPAITPALLPTATAGKPYSQALTASGGNGAYAFSVAGGSLPPGLSLSVSGQLMGTPTTLATASFTAAATDAAQCAGTQSYALFICGITLGETSATFAPGAASRQVSVAANAADCAWSASSSAPWVTITSGSGTGSGTLGFSVAPNTSPAARTATITVGSQIYTVTQNGLVVQKQPDPPIGSFDTPVNGVTVTGSIAVTGWTLSTQGIDRVEIWRDLVSGETTPPYTGSGPGNGKVFIANGTFVKGARPDLAGSGCQATPSATCPYADFPNRDRAGWGYLMLTQGLWNVGNGTFTLYAFAFDVDGRSTALCANIAQATGQCLSTTKTITANNTQSVKPFGALDTPGYGATVSGGFWNYGWALTPNGNTTDPRSCVITDGNIYVGIDSQPIVPVHYGDTRTDIAGFFPGFSNGSSAGGAYYIDTTALGNGDHQIGWYVIDSCGRADGIGSRIFTVLNGVNITTDAAPRVLAPDTLAALVAGEAGSRAADVAQVLRPALSEDPILVRIDQQPRWSYPDDQQVHAIAITQRSRIEVELPRAEGQVYRGGEIVGGAERALPLGSSLDAVRGVFYWEPAPAFLGSYELVFAAGDGAPVRVRVVVETAK